MSHYDESTWLNEDGSAKDPLQYRELLRSDPERWKKIEEDPETAAIILGDDVQAFQELLKSAMEVEASTTYCSSRCFTVCTQSFR